MINNRSDIHKNRIVIDSNVWLSGLIFGGNPGKILELFINESIVVFTSEELLSEISRIVIKKFPLFVPKLTLLIASIRKDALCVKLGSNTITVCRDSDDNKVLETATIGNCDYIISGDNDLLSLNNYQGIKIVTPAQFLNEYHKIID